MRLAFRDPSPLLGDNLGLYKYPARLSPRFVREAIELFSDPNDFVLDPFVGGGTTAVEALAEGRRVLAIDVSPLACLLTRARTTPLDDAERSRLKRWASGLVIDRRRKTPLDSRALGMPQSLSAYLVPAREAVREVRPMSVRVAATAVLLRLGQRAVEDPDQLESMTRGVWREHAEDYADSLLRSIDQLVVRSEDRGIRESRIPERITIKCGRAEEVLAHRRGMKFALVVTSPPYPGVHVLYHRWQLGGRRELAVPFWIANAQDGAGPSYYTMGGRHERGLERYFVSLGSVMRSVRMQLRDGGVVVQVVSFSNLGVQRKRFSEVLDEAGLQRHHSFARLSWRSIPGRRWYARERRNTASREFLFVNRATPPE